MFRIVVWLSFSLFVFVFLFRFFSFVFEVCTVSFCGFERRVGEIVRSGGSSFYCYVGYVFVETRFRYGFDF